MYRQRTVFRAWRRSRPFWGGLLVLLAGLELLSIPLSGVLIKGQVKLVIYIGIGGVSGVLIGVLMAAAGIIMWVNPAHRVFYGIAGIVLGIISFPASNLGGFLAGMLLAITGGAMAFAWQPGESPPRPGPDVTRADTPVVARNTPRKPRPSGSRSASGSRILAVAALPAMLAAGMTGSGSVRPAALPQADGSCIPGVFCSSPSPSPSPSGMEAAGAAPGGVLTSLLPSGRVPGAPASPPPSADDGGTPGNAKVKQAATPSGVVAPSATSVLTARSATMRHFNFAGVATVPAAGGGDEQALKFTASSAVMSAVALTVTQDGSSGVTTTTSLGFNGGMTLYTTRLCGQVENITPVICFTPGTASEITLKLASVLGSSAPITMTSVTTDQFTVSAGSMQWGALSMSA